MAQKKNKGGRPPLMTPKTLEKLREAYFWDATDLEACLHAGISTATLYLYQRNNPEFINEKEKLKKAVTLRAKRIVYDDITQANDKHTAKWVLERRAKDEYSTTVNANQRFVDKEGEDLHEKDLRVLRQLGLIGEKHES